MRNLENGYRLVGVVYFVDGADVPDSDAPTLSVGQPAATRWTRFFGKGPEGCFYAILHLCGESRYLFLCPTPTE